MLDVPEDVSNKIVIKRDGKKVQFDGTKIALAIQKGFGDVIGLQEPSKAKYNETDVNKVYSKVLQRIEEMQVDKIKIEQIQDLIEEELKKNGYQDVYEAFSSYREKRAQSRKLFFDEKKQHKFLKALENLSLNVEKEEENRHAAMRTMLQYGTTVSREFAKSYLMKKKFSEAHENGDIYIHNMEYLPMGTTNCCHIDLNKLYKDGFWAGYAFMREPNDVMSYANLAAIAILSNQNDQHGEQDISAFDYYMANGVIKTFKKQFKQTVYEYLELTDFNKFIAMNGIEREIDKITHIEFDINIFNRFCRNSKELERLFKLAYKKAYEKTNNLTLQAMEAFIHNVNNIHSRGGAMVPYSSVNLGTDTSPEGRIVTKNFLKALEAGVGNSKFSIFPICIFKVKEGINYREGEPNYDLLKRAFEVCSKRNSPKFSFIDAKFNKKYYKNNEYETEVSYTGSGIRVLENKVDTDKQISSGRGNLCTTTINLPRLGIKYAGITDEKQKTYALLLELEEKMDIVKDQLLERYEIQCNQRMSNFPFLLGQNIWLDSEKLKSTDNLKRVLKHGTLSIGFVGLTECLKALLGKYHGESEEAQKIGLKIIEFMKNKCDEYSQKYNLNFTLSGSEGKSGAYFIKLDQAIYGKLKGITDKESYTNAFNLPANCKISVENRIKIEAPYQALTNGGHILEVEIGSEKQYMQTLQYLRNAEVRFRNH